MGLEWGTDDLKDLEVDLSGTPLRTQFKVQGELRGRSGRRLAGEMRKDARNHQGNWFGRPGTSFNTGLERHVSHEMVGPYEVEAGIEAKGSGKLGAIIAYGSVNNAPAYDPGAGPRRALPVIMEYLGDTGEETMLGDDR